MHRQARLNPTPNTVARTGEATACTNPAGAFDMVGNLHEWTDDGTLHGGFYLDVKTLHEGCDYVASAHVPVYYDYATGFRCCADPSLDVPEEAKAKPSGGKKVAHR
jgi:formylglycine-generating enzyme required for sulfatase activity